MADLSAIGHEKSTLNVVGYKYLQIPADRRKVVVSLGAILNNSCGIHKETVKRSARGNVDQ